MKAVSPPHDVSAIAGIDRNALARAAATVRDFAEVNAAWIHGSVACGNARPGSDIDIAVLPEHGSAPSLERQATLIASLADIFKRDIDLSILTSRNVVLAKEVAVHGQLIFARDHTFSDDFIARSLAMYADLQRSRKPVIDAYSA